MFARIVEVFLKYFHRELRTINNVTQGKIQDKTQNKVQDITQGKMIRKCLNGYRGHLTAAAVFGGLEVVLEVFIPMLMSVIVDGGLYREEDFMLRGLFPDALVAQRNRFVLTVGGIMDFAVLIPGGIGALATIILFAKAVDSLFNNHYSVAFHAIIGVVIAATIMIIPFGSFTVSVTSALINVFFVCFGIVAALLLDKFNQKFAV